jgi:hypothetical protein
MQDEMISTNALIGLDHWDYSPMIFHCMKTILCVVGPDISALWFLRASKRVR